MTRCDAMFGAETCLLTQAIASCHFGEFAYFGCLLVVLDSILFIYGLNECCIRFHCGTSRLLSWDSRDYNGIDNKRQPSSKFSESNLCSLSVFGKYQ